MLGKSRILTISRAKIWVTALAVNEYCGAGALDQLASKCIRRGSLVVEFEDRIASRAVIAAFEIFSFMWLADVSAR